LMETLPFGSKPCNKIIRQIRSEIGKPLNIKKGGYEKKMRSEEVDNCHE
jgi:hypothetical protein